MKNLRGTFAFLEDGKIVRRQLTPDERQKVAQLEARHYRSYENATWNVLNAELSGQFSLSAPSSPRASK
jgi:hypothetical protein